MMEEDDPQNLIQAGTSEERSSSSHASDLEDQTLQIDISDALSEREKVKFTVHTKTELKEFQGTEFSVIREHEEFIWLHERFIENEEYAGIIIPPPPPRPDFDASREKLQTLSEGEVTMTKEEFQKMKQELEAEYLATFKKTVAMHEVFLTRLAAHPLLRNDHNLRVFLEYKEDLNVRGKNTKEFLKGIAKGIGKTVDEKVLLSGQKDVDEFFENEKKSQVEYFNRIKDATLKCDKMTTSHKRMADTYIKISAGLTEIATSDKSELEKVLNKASEAFEKLRKIEGRMATDEDLKLADLLRYHMRDTEAAKDLLYRRLRCLANLEAANKNLDKARAKNKEVAALPFTTRVIESASDQEPEPRSKTSNHPLTLAEKVQKAASEKFETMSETGKTELAELRKKKVAHFKKNLIELADLEFKHAKAQVILINSTIKSLQED